MENNLDIVPISKVFSIIDSCINSSQLKVCEKLANFYTADLRRQGVINFNDAKTNIFIKILEKREELELSENFS